MDGTYDYALKRWFELGKIERVLGNEIQKNWTEPNFGQRNCRFDFTSGRKEMQRVPRQIWLERYPVKKFKVKTVKPIFQN